MCRTLPLIALGAISLCWSCVQAAAEGGVRRNDPPVTVLHPMAHVSGADEDQANEGASAGGWPLFVRWVGHFHPPLTAFPIAMLLGAALAELLRIVNGPLWLEGASRWCVIVGAVAAVITAPLGWAFAAEHDESRLLEIHRWLGTAAGAGAAVILPFSEMSRRSNRAGWRAAFRAVLFLAVPLVGATGFFGGAMIYGLHEYDWNPPRSVTGDRHDDGDHYLANAGGGAAAPSGRQPAEPGLAVVDMTDDDVFTPESISIAAGTTVRWTNRSKESHTVTDDPNAASDPKDVALPAGARPFDSGKIKPGGTFAQKFTVPGTYRYVCRPHEEMGMKGTVLVKGGG